MGEGLGGEKGAGGNGEDEHLSGLRSVVLKGMVSGGGRGLGVEEFWVSIVGIGFQQKFIEGGSFVPLYVNVA